MENIVTLIIVALFLTFLYVSGKQTSDNNNKEKLMLIREISTSIKSPTVLEYTDNLQEYELKKEVKEIIKDDIVEIDQVEPEILLRAITK